MRELTRRQARINVTVLDNPYIPTDPTERQCDFLTCDAKEAMYGGAAGGGKSEALLMAALQYIDVPGYAALLLRRKFSDLELPNALIPRSHAWLAGTGAQYNSTKHEWRFPGGGTLTFGYMDNANDIYRYQSSEYQFIGWDELTQFVEAQYTYMFSRLRRLEGAEAPLRMRSATNPGGVGHEWVKERFVSPATPERPFFPAKLQDNPYLDRAEYEESLSQLDPIRKAQLLAGDWVQAQGTIMKREWFEIVDDYPKDTWPVRAWDLAGTEYNGQNDPDYTVGLKMCESGGVYYITHVIRKRENPGEVERIVRQAAETDNCRIRMWEDPAQAGKSQIVAYRKVLAEWDFRGVKVGGSKLINASPLASAAYAGNVRILRAPWNAPFLDEIDAFDGSSKVHDDQVDAASLAYKTLSRGGSTIVMGAFG